MWVQLSLRMLIWGSWKVKRLTGQKKNVVPSVLGIGNAVPDQMIIHQVVYRVKYTTLCLLPVPLFFSSLWSSFDPSIPTMKPLNVTFTDCTHFIFHPSRHHMGLPSFSSNDTDVYLLSLSPSPSPPQIR